MNSFCVDQINRGILNNLIEQVYLSIWHTLCISKQLELSYFGTKKTICCDTSVFHTRKQLFKLELIFVLHVLQS